jgi:hypothetical protein
MHDVLHYGLGYLLCVASGLAVHWLRVHVMLCCPVFGHTKRFNMLWLGLRADCLGLSCLNKAAVWCATEVCGLHWHVCATEHVPCTSLQPN